MRWSEWRLSRSVVGSIVETDDRAPLLWFGVHAAAHPAYAGPMPLTPEAREAMLAALASHMGAEQSRVFSKMLPARPWREVVPSHHWFRREVWEAVGGFAPQRFLLHEGLIELIGEEHAGTLMEYLMPAPWRALERLGVPLLGEQVAAA